MHPMCTLCFREFNPKLWESAAPVAPPCGHTLCYECLDSADQHPCYVRCGEITSAEEVRPIRMKLVDCGVNNWKELLSSKARKRLQEANMGLEELGIELDKERTKLAQALGDFAADGSFEATLHSLAGNLNGLEETSFEFYTQILAYSKRLEQLEAEIRAVRKVKESAV